MNRVFWWWICCGAGAVACWDFAPGCPAEGCRDVNSASPGETPPDLSAPVAGAGGGVAAAAEPDAATAAPDVSATGGAGGSSVAPGAGGGASGSVSPAPDTSPDAAPEGDAGADAPDTGVGPVPVDPCGAALAAKPRELCLGSECLPLDCAERQALVLWLDPTTLPAAGSELTSWPDRSGLAHHAERRLDAPPLGVQEEARGVAEQLQRAVLLTGNWLSLAQPLGDDALRFGTSEFLVLVAASVPPEQLPNTFLYVASDSFGSLELSLASDCGGVFGVDAFNTQSFSVTSHVSGLFDDRPRLFGVRRRAATQLELRINGSGVEGLQCLSPELSLNADDDAASALGTASINRSESASRGRLSAVVVFKGHLETEQVERVEQFLCRQLGVCSALPPPSSDPDPFCTGEEDAAICSEPE